MRLLLLAGAILAASLLPGSVSAQSKSRVVPEDWLPALFPSIQFALGQLKEADTQKDMNALSSQVANMIDAQLYIAYVRLYERLGTKERAALLAEQTKWLTSRTKAAKDAAGDGSLAPLEANNAELTLTEARLKELRARLKKITNKEE